MSNPTETPITSADAEGLHGMHAKHGLMENGEKRFRLTKIGEGSGYIRTEASSTGGWQNAHYHEQVLETYVVQSGWIVACELRDGAYRYVRYNAGEVFTTSPRVVHNIYMPGQAVIHTVKHGQTPQGAPVDRVEKADAPERMTAANKALSETELLALVRTPPPLLVDTKPASTAQDEAVKPYNDVYRHFDNLIWKTPAWSVAVLTIAVVGASNLRKDGAVAQFLGLPDAKQAYLPASVFLCMGLFLVLLSYILYRFRWHQASSLPRKPKSRFLKSQAALQLFISLEALALLGVGLWGVGLPVQWLLSGLVVLLLALHVAIENSIFANACKEDKTYTPS